MNKHEKLVMEVAGRDYVTRRLGKKSTHHVLIFACPGCGSEKRYFANLIGCRGNPVCDGITQKLS